MIHRPALAAICLLVIAGCAGEDTGVSKNAAIDLINADKVRVHLHALASDEMEGRMTGEPGYDRAAAYVAEAFEALGLDPGGTDGYYQPVTFQTYKLQSDEARLIVHRDGGDVQLVYRKDFAMPGDRVREQTEVRAEVVYAGFGVHAPEHAYSDYDGLDVDGKIVALFGGAPSILESTQRAHYASTRTKVREALGRGAVGFVLLRSERDEERYSWERIQKVMGSRPGFTWLDASGDAADFFPQNRGSVILSTGAATALMSGTPISFEEAREAIAADRPASIPLGVEVTIQTKTSHEETTSPNVIGVVRGSDPELADEYVVYSAHLDHLGRGVEVDGDDLYNGAYDNAMGIALMLEAARAFAASPPRRSALFIAVTAEERGLLGSDYYAAYPTVPIESIVANVNLDMPLFLYPVADVVAFGSEHSTLEEVVRTAAAAEDFVLSPDPFPEENIFVRSDQYSFVRRGVPSIYLIPGVTSVDPSIDGQAVFNEHLRQHYHQPSDDLSRPIDWPSAERFARANARIGMDIANADERPLWKRGNFFGDKFGRPGVTIPAPN